MSAATTLTSIRPGDRAQRKSIYAILDLHDILGTAKAQAIMKVIPRNFPFQARFSRTKRFAIVQIKPSFNLDRIPWAKVRSSGGVVWVGGHAGIKRIIEADPARWPCTPGEEGE